MVLRWCTLAESDYFLIMLSNSATTTSSPWLLFCNPVCPSVLCPSGIVACLFLYLSGFLFFIFLLVILQHQSPAWFSILLPIWSMLWGILEAEGNAGSYLSQSLCLRLKTPNQAYEGTTSILCVFPDQVYVTRRWNSSTLIYMDLLEKSLTFLWFF